MSMGLAAQVPVEEYLERSYSPDREYRDGVLLDRNVGDKAHAALQTLLAIYIGIRRKQWNVEVYTGLRVKARENWYPIPDVCVYTAPFEECCPGKAAAFVDRDPLAR